MKKYHSGLSHYKDFGPEDVFDGRYYIPHNKIAGYYYQVVVSSGGMGWEHVSITLISHQTGKMKDVDRCPTWGEMCHIKDLFWDETEAVIQYHPPKELYVNNHPYCLHLWKSTEFEFPVPPRILVGV